MTRRGLIRAWFVLALLLAGCSTAKKCSPVQVAPGIYEGCLPATEQDFESLREQGVRTVLSLETLTWHIVPERKLAERHGMTFRNVPILPSIVRPKDDSIRKVLLTMNDREKQPIFVHCLVGDDRTTFVVGLYRVYFENWTPQAAWDEMLQRGFHDRWWLSGLTSYFWKHTRKPNWANSNAASEETLSLPGNMLIGPKRKSPD